MHSGRRQEDAKRLQDLQTQEDALTQFFSKLMHDMRLPISTITGYADLLGNDDLRQDPEFVVKCQEVVLTQSQSLNELTRDALTVWMLDTGRYEFVMAPVDFAELATEIAQAQTTKSGRMIKVENGLAGQAIVLGDLLRLREVLVQLVSNAMKYSYPPEPIEIILAAGGTPGWIKLSVRDYGMGIIETERPHLFQPFYRIKSPKTMGIPGSGLGLYIVKRIVEMHGGQIDLSTQAEVGSTFTVSLPAGQA